MASARIVEGGNFRLWIVDCGLQIVDCGLQIVDCGLQMRKIKEIVQVKLKLVGKKDLHRNLHTLRYQDSDAE
jgi:hypothetical protein